MREINLQHVLFLLLVWLLHASAEVHKISYVTNDMNSTLNHEETIHFLWKPSVDYNKHWSVVGLDDCSVRVKCYLNLGEADQFCSRSFPRVWVRNEQGSQSKACGNKYWTLTPLVDNNLRDIYLEFAVNTANRRLTGFYAYCFARCATSADTWSDVDGLGYSYDYNPEYHLTHDLFNSLHFNSPKRFMWQNEDGLTKPEMAFWNVFGLEKCPVNINCSLQMHDVCSEGGPFVKISDGSSGEKIFCGNESFSVRPSQDKLRDLFLKVYSPRDGHGVKLSCWAQCSSQDADPLPINVQRKTDVRCVCGLQNNNDRIVVINDRFILTAFHCTARFIPAKVQVVVHMHTPGKRVKGPQIADADKLEKTQRFNVTEFIRPSGLYYRYRDDYDVALLRIDGRINLADSDSPTPICLPSADAHNTFNDRLLGHMLTVIGWGTQETVPHSTSLKKVDVPYVPKNECNILQHSYSTDSPRMMCAFDKNDYTKAKGACTGDSGGPLFYKQKNKQHVQVGIASWITGSCIIPGALNVYATVSEIVQWIEFHSNEWDAKWCQDWGRD